MSSDVSWKTFDVKIAPVLSAWDDAEGTMLGVSLSIVKPITSYLGAGVIIEAGTNSSGCEECDSYDFNELSEGVLLNMNIPFGSTNLSLLSNFMFRSNLGIAWRTSSKRFGLELYPVDFAVTDYDVRVTFSPNAVFRAF